jgi:hypothetical protein
MKHQKTIYITLLILGLIFSVFAGFYFNWQNGFEFKGYWFRSTPNLVDIALNSSLELKLRSTLVGNLFYSIFAILFFVKQPELRKSSELIAFIVLVSLINISDLYSIYQDINNEFIGRHIRIGLIIFIIGVLCVRKLKSKSEKVNTSGKA